MYSFQKICVENGLTFEEVTRVVKHLLYWGMGKIIYPIRPSGIYGLTKETRQILQNPAVVEQLTQKLPFFFDQLRVGGGVGAAEDPGTLALKKALLMFQKPVSLQHVTKKKKRPM